MTKTFERTNSHNVAHRHAPSSDRRHKAIKVKRLTENVPLFHRHRTSTTIVVVRHPPLIRIRHSVI